MSGIVTFETAWTLALSEVIKSAVALFFTGICILLAVIAVYFLRRRGAPGHDAFSCALGVMGLLAIGQTVLHIFSAVWVLRIAYSAAHGETTDPVGGPDYLGHVNDRISCVELTLFWTDNLVADSVFVEFLSSKLSSVLMNTIYRCYVIWSSSRFKKKIITVPVVLPASDYSSWPSRGSLCRHSHRKHSFSNWSGALQTVTNMFLTGLMAGRIWRTRRYLRIVDKTAFVKRYNTAVAMIVESGAAYVLLAILAIIAASVSQSSTSPSNQWWFDSVFTACGQLLNIIPMLVIVRISLGRSVEVEIADRELA